MARDQEPPDRMPPPARWQREFAAEPVIVGEIRRGVADFARAHGASEDVLDNLSLAVSEAATNAVLHAYVEQAGPGDVHVTTDHGPGAMCVHVRDDGRGMTPRSDSPGSGFGLMLIAQYADHHEVLPAPAGGTSLRMRFSLAR
jgi:anti-sigma regulatory factor (Ser/Thr protein kinase)